MNQIPQNQIHNHKMPRNTDNVKPTSKYSKKVSLNREKLFARSEDEINLNNEKLDTWNQHRKNERNKNKNIAAGIVDEDEDAEDEIIPKRVSRKGPTIVSYYTKLNLIINELPSSYGIDNILRSFQEMGKIDYIHTRTNENSTYNARIVADEWNENIQKIQTDIFEKGFALFDISKYVNCKIQKDPNQPEEEYGEKIDNLEGDDEYE